MTRIEACELPQDALLTRYQGDRGYTDCYRITIPGNIDHATYVEAFYTTPLFKLERLVIATFVGRPSNDEQAGQLANGTASAFAAWTVEDRAPNQLLLCDYQERTRSWLMCVRGAAATTLYFGSAVVQKRNGTAGTALFHLLLPLHKLYSRALLRAAVRRLG